MDNSILLGERNLDLALIEKWLSTRFFKAESVKENMETPPGIEPG